VSSSRITITVYPKVKYTLSISVDRNSGYVGDTFNFSGTFSYNGTPVSGARVALLRDGIEIDSTYTGTNGSWKISWTADREGTFTFQAEGEIPSGYPPAA